jgi:HSP20 family protein
MAGEKNIAKTEERRDLDLLRWPSPFSMMDRMIRDFWEAPGTMLKNWKPEFTPEVDLKETDKEFKLSATVPGMTKDDIDIDVTKDSVSVCGERKTEEEKPGEKFHVKQQSYGSFSVSYSLPSEIKPEDVKATYKNGMLEITLPKAEASVSKKVKVEGES